MTAIDSTDYDAEITAKMVTEVFSTSNTGMRVYKSDLRFKELNKEMNKLYNALDEVAKNPKSSFAQNKLRALIRKESRFAAFKRCYIREYQTQYTNYL